MSSLEVFEEPEYIGCLIRCAACGVSTDRAVQIFTPDEGKRRVICGMCEQRGWNLDPDGNLFRWEG